MIDLHCHILPGLDDGARHPEEALHMACLAVESGVSAVVATPHCVDGGADVVLTGVQDLRSALQEAQIPLQVYPGMEIFGSPDTARLLQTGQLLTLNGSRYPLIEFAFDADGEEETQILADVLRAGFVPIVAHPERYQWVRQDPRILNLWTSMGCLLQVNKGSLLGRFGEGPRQMAMEMTDRGFTTVVGSDAHYARLRTPWLYEAWELLARQFAPLAAKVLLEENPRRILKNESILPAQPEWFKKRERK